MDLYNLENVSSVTYMMSDEQEISNYFRRLRDCCVFDDSNDNGILFQVGLLI